MKHLFLILAIFGTVIPYFFFLQFIAGQGLAPPAFLSALFVNGATAGFTADLLISSCVFWLFLYVEKAERMWLYILLNLTIGLSCALPLYVYMKLRAAETNSAAA
jgi:hypothetical protein